MKKLFKKLGRVISKTPKSVTGVFLIVAGEVAKPYAMPVGVALEKVGIILLTAGAGYKLIKAKKGMDPFSAERSIAGRLRLK